MPFLVVEAVIALYDVLGFARTEVSLDAEIDLVLLYLDFLLYILLNAGDCLCIVCKASDSSDIVR